MKIEVRKHKDEIHVCLIDNGSVVVRYITTPEHTEEGVNRVREEARANGIIVRHISYPS